MQSCNAKHDAKIIFLSPNCKERSQKRMVNYAAVLQENNSELRFVASKYTFQVAGSMTNTLALSAQAGSSSQSTAMVIDSAGNVGIGTATPGYKLHVQGDLNFTGALKQNGAAYVGSQWTTSGANVYMGSGCNVGVGTNNPGTTSLFVNQTAVAGVGLQVKGAAGQTANTAEFYPNGSSTAVFVVNKDGYVGIGTANPSTTLHVVDSITCQNIMNTPTTGNAFLQLDSSPVDTVSSARIRIFRNTNTSGVKLVQIHRGDGSATTDAQIGVDGQNSWLLSGNTGFGTSSPTARAHVYNDTAATTAALITQTAVAGVGLQVKCPASQTANTAEFFAAGSATANVVVDEAGYVGIGTINPETPFHVKKNSSTYRICTAENLYNAGGAGTYYSILQSLANSTSGYHFVGNINGVGDRVILYGNGNIVNNNNSYGALSDLKLKQDISNASSQWDDIKKLKIKKYRFKQDVMESSNAPYHIGLIAQDVEITSSNLVDSSFDRDSITGQQTNEITKSIKYSILYMKAVKALQEAMLRIELLEEKMTQLQELYMS